MNTTRALLLALLLCLCLAAPSFAEGTDTPADTPTPTYSVNVTWGTTDFVYQSTKAWNPETLSYDSVGGSWSPSSSIVTVQNNSTASVVATITQAITYPADGMSTIAIQFYNDITILTLDAGKTGAFTFSLTGAPTEELYNQTLGTLTVTITAAP